MRKGHPGAVARSAFRTGMISATILGLIGLWALSMSGVSDTMLLYLLVVMFPLYLVVAAAVVNSWLGYGGDAIPLVPVMVPASQTDGDGDVDALGEGAERTSNGHGRPVDSTADQRTHLGLIVGTVGVGIPAALLGLPHVAVFCLLFAFLATVLWMLRFLWPRLETYYEGRAAARADASRGGPGALLSAESKAGMTVTALVYLLLVVAVAVSNVVG